LKRELSLSLTAKVYILGILLAGGLLIVRMGMSLDLENPYLYLLGVLGAVGQTLKVEGPTNRTNYSIAWFVYGFAFIAFGSVTAMAVIIFSHLIEWIWHKYPWYIQSFNIGNHVLSVFLAGLVFELITRGTGRVDLTTALGMTAAALVLVFVNHFLLGVVVELARGQSFAESGLFEFLTLFLDFTILSMGAATALIWRVNPFASVLNILPLYLLYTPCRCPPSSAGWRR